MPATKTQVKTAVITDRRVFPVNDLRNGWALAMDTYGDVRVEQRTDAGIIFEAHFRNGRLRWGCGRPVTE